MADKDLEILDTGAQGSGIILGRWGVSTAPTTISFGKSRNASIGSFDILIDNDNIAQLEAFASDEVDLATSIARITFTVDDATPAASDIGGELEFYTAPGGGAGPTRIVAGMDAAGDVTLYAGDLDLNSNGGVLNVAAAGNDWTSTTLSVNNANIGSDIAIGWHNGTEINLLTGEADISLITNKSSS